MSVKWGTDDYSNQKQQELRLQKMMRRRRLFFLTLLLSLVVFFFFLSEFKFSESKKWERKLHSIQQTGLSFAGFAWTRIRGEASPGAGESSD